MTRTGFIFALIFVAILAGIAWMKSHGAVEVPVLVDAPAHNTAIPQDDRIIIPWQLNTRCSINSRNLPVRDPERNA